MRSPAEPDARTEVALDEAYECLRAIRQRGCLEPDEEYEDAAERAHALIALLFNPTISDDVRDWWLRLADQPGPSRKGRSAKRRRDFWITHVIELLVDKYDLTPTRSRGSKYQQQLTACAIVARALSKLGITLAESTVEVIWSRRSVDIIWSRRGKLPAWFYLSPKTAKYMATLLKYARSPVQ
jgi:hypothetical protein